MDCFKLLKRLDKSNENQDSRPCSLEGKGADLFFFF